MNNLILDDLLVRNKVGTAIVEELESKCGKSIQIISPYISDIERLVHIENCQKIQFICDAYSNSCNPYTLESLISKSYIEISTRSDIHAKIYIFNNSAFITSANATPNGIGIGTLEAAVKITEEDQLKEVNDWFEQLWVDSNTDDVKKFSTETWEKLKANWKIRNRKNNSKISLYDLIITKRIPADVSFTFGMM